MAAIGSLIVTRSFSCLTVKFPLALNGVVKLQLEDLRSRVPLQLPEKFGIAVVDLKAEILNLLACLL